MKNNTVFIAQDHWHLLQLLLDQLSSFCIDSSQKSTIEKSIIFCSLWRIIYSFFHLYENTVTKMHFLLTNLFMIFLCWQTACVFQASLFLHRMALKKPHLTWGIHSGLFLPKGIKMPNSENSYLTFPTKQVSVQCISLVP